MALTVANVATPNARINEWSEGPYKARMIDITFDNSYPTGGEVLTAASLGWSQIFGAIVLTHPVNSAGTLHRMLFPRKNTANTQLNLIIATTASAEAANASDQSAFTARVIVLGY